MRKSNVANESWMHSPRELRKSSNTRIAKQNINSQEY